VEDGATTMNDVLMDLIGIQERDTNANSEPAHDAPMAFDSTQTKSSAMWRQSFQICEPYQPWQITLAIKTIVTVSRISCLSVSDCSKRERERERERE
jgi:hypothetical protein